jgi:glycerophosphoryl diester phosphodiesterase
VSALSAQELSEKYGVTSLWEVLSDSEGTASYNVEIKADGLSFVRIVRKVSAVVRDQPGRVVLSSFSPGVLLVASLYCPKVAKAFLVDHMNFAKWLWTWLLPVKWIHLNYKAANRSLIEKVRQRGFSLAVWTVNEEAVASGLLNSGIQSVITDSLFLKSRTER